MSGFKTNDVIYTDKYTISKLMSKRYIPKSKSLTYDIIDTVVPIFPTNTTPSLQIVIYL